MRRPVAHVAVVVAACAVLAAAAGCATVPAWKRGILAHRSMDRAYAPGQDGEAFLTHSEDVREGFTPCGRGQAGGGCGCN